MFSARQLATRPYAVAADFCRIFNHDMNRLYLLAYLLTGDHAMAEECFVRGLEDSTTSNRVFREWAESWARRTVIHNAIQMVRPRPTDRSVSRPDVRDVTDAAPIAAVIELPAFERFAFVMSVLERHSLQESSILLGCSREEVMAGRDRALRQIGRAAGVSRESAPRTGGGAAVRRAAAQHLAASA